MLLAADHVYALLKKQMEIKIVRKKRSLRDINHAELMQGIKRSSCHEPTALAIKLKTPALMLKDRNAGAKPWSFKTGH